MKKLFLSFAIFGLVGFNINIPDIPRINIRDKIEKIRREVPESSFGTYTDSSYTNRQTSFSPGQTIYVLAEARIDENANRSLVLQDANKNKVRDIPVAISERGYVADFTAPSISGMYYLHFEVIGEGLSIVFQTNINVGDGGSGGEVVGESTVVSDVTTEVISSNENTGQDEREQKMPNNRLNPFQIVGWWVRRLKELIINFLSEA